MSQLENKIIVMYIGVAGIRSEDIEDFIPATPIYITIILFSN
jgi:hypothetical protein